jgi:asparagine synthase (glutamine-hydrolysing)
MCGILLVKSRSNIPLEKHLSTFVKLQSRGPDFCRYQYQNNTFIGHAVLHITGSADYYHTQHQNFLAYNGEIYNYKEFGPWETDTAFVHHAVEHDLDLLKEAWGPWAWAWTDGDVVRYATDPQGERALYQYQDDDILIVCSEIAPILEYINSAKADVPYVNKTWTMLDRTPWQGITKITPGLLYLDGQATYQIDSIWSWVAEPLHHTLDEAYEDFESRWRQVIKQMTPNCPAALTYSGGLDSSVILSHLPGLDLYSINCVGKDPIVDQINEFLHPEEQARLHVTALSESQWADEMSQMMARTCMPPLSWSWVGQWTVTRHCQQRVLFTGAGADELFGGYDVYRNIDYSTTSCSSPYSRYTDPETWQRCLSVYDNDPVQATLLMDYWHQIVGCDARAVDLIAGAWGIEPRNPFLAKPIMQLALNLPSRFKVTSESKPLIRRLFLQRWTLDHILPKKGFTGHANDSATWLATDIKPSGDRMVDWQKIVRQCFYAS